MVINRNKSLNLNTEVEHSGKVQYNFDYNTLSLFFAFILCENKRISKTDYHRLIELMDMSVFEADPSRLKIIDIIKKGLSARLDKNLTKKELILSFIKGGVMEISNEDLDTFSDLNDDEIDYISNEVSNALNCSVIQNEMNELKRIATQYDMGDYKTKSDMVDSVEDYIYRVHNNLKNNRRDKDNESSFSFTDKKSIINGLTRVYNTITKPNRFLVSGLQGLNIMLGGGFEETRFYLLLGNAGVGKSLLLLKVATSSKHES